MNEQESNLLNRMQIIENKIDIIGEMIYDKLVKNEVCTNVKENRIKKKIRKKKEEKKSIKMKEID